MPARPGEGASRPRFRGSSTRPRSSSPGSAVGAVPAGRPAILGDDLAPGDEIVFVESSGLHANGASLARAVARTLDDGYATSLSDGRTFGEALLAPTVLYSPLVARMLADELPVHYLSHITGHGFLKLMRPNRAFTYRITAIPPVPPVLAFLADRAEMSPAAAYSTFNMGCGFAVYCAAGAGGSVVAAARGLGLAAHVSGTVEAGPRRVVIEPIGVTYESDAMDLTPGRAA